ncbi:Y-family DNA polymerase, partial [Nitratireductor aquibiodomus]|uniref:Y-family DNA polymerase n=1 Tax=Nitratireductor aquibiodomus TaxID=204799 RepID=UPI003F94FF6D
MSRHFSSGWDVEWDHDTLSFRLPTPLADRTPAWATKGSTAGASAWPHDAGRGNAEWAEAHEAEPLVLVTTTDNGQRITALNPAAEALGFSPGMALADARAIHPALRVAHADLPGDERALIRLALWCQCFSPLTRPDFPDGVSLDIAGCAHLFGGE